MSNGRFRGVLLFILTSACGTSGNGAVDETEPPTFHDASSWDTTLTFQFVGTKPEWSSCSRASFTTHLDPSGTALDAILGRDGESTSARFVATSDAADSYALEETLYLANEWTDCSVYDIGIRSLTLFGRDTDGDGQIDSIDGTGNAVGSVGTGAITNVSLAVELHGALDNIAPSIIVPAAPREPLDALVLAATEPVTPTSEVTLVSSTEQYPLAGSPSGAFVRFSANTILPFGSAFQVRAQGMDLGGIAFDPSASATLTLVDDPGIFVEDGFESAPNALLTTGAEVVTNVATVSAITGQRSLFIPPGASATLHLLKQPGASHLRFTARLLSRGGQGFGSTEPSRSSAVEVGALGGSTRNSATLRYDIDPKSETGDSSWRFAGSNQDVSVDVPDEGSDVVVRFRPPHLCAPHLELCQTDPALLIDDVRIE